MKTSTARWALLFSLFLPVNVLWCGASLAEDPAPLANVANPADYDQLTVKLTPAQFSAFQTRADAGDPVGIDAVLFCSLYGFGTPCHFGNARKWMQRGLEVHAPAATMYGAKCLTGYWLDPRAIDPEKAKALSTQAVQYFRPLAEKGSVFAQNMLAQALLVQHDITGVAVCRKAAEGGDAVAQNYLGDLYFRGELVSQNYDVALDWFQKAAEQNLTVAMHCVGAWHYLGPKKNATEALKWYAMAAERGYAPAIGMMVKSSCKGEGVRADPLTALRWLTIANRQGFRCFRFLDDYDAGDPEYKRSPREIVDWFIQKANAGSSDHLDSLGMFYENGFGLPKDLDKAFEYYKKAIELGHHEAVHDLVKAYIYGNDGIVNGPEVFKWSQRAAALQCAQGKRQLADCYDYGWGTPRDPRKALELFEQAADPNDTNLLQRIAGLKQVVADMDQARKGLGPLEEKAAKGDAEAMLQLSVAYDNGKAVDRDPLKAAAWEEKAAVAGNITASARIGSRYANGNGVAADMTKAYGFLKQAATSGEVQHLYQLGRFLEHNKGLFPSAPKEMFDAYKAAAEKGDRECILQLARCYNWARGVDENCTEAIKWYEKIMDMDFRPKFEVGMILVLGRGGAAQDIPRGFALVEEAAQTAKAGDPQFELGRMYHEGIGAKKDDAKAIEWLKKSKANGNTAADHLLNELTATPAKNEDF